MRIVKASRAVVCPVRYTVFAMQNPVTAQDLLPLVEKLSHDEQVRLAKLALRAASLGRSSRSAYEADPPKPGEFDNDDEDPLAWDAGGWEQFGAPR